MSGQNNNNLSNKWALKNSVSRTYAFCFLTYLSVIVFLSFFKFIDAFFNILGGDCGDNLIYELTLIIIRFFFIIDLELELIIYSIVAATLLIAVWLLASQPKWPIISKCAKYLGVTLVILHTLFIFYISALFYFIELLTCAFSVFS